MPSQHVQGVGNVTIYPRKGRPSTIAFSDSRHPKGRICQSLNKDESVEDGARRLKAGYGAELGTSTGPAGSSADSTINSDPDAADGGKAAHDEGSRVFEPATQQMDTDDDSNRPSSPADLGDLDAAACQLCDDTDGIPALDLFGGKFCCTGCLESAAEDEWRAKVIADAAEAQFTARATAAALAPPEPPALEPRRSARTIKPVGAIYDLERTGKGQPGWSGYDLQRLGARHDRTREESYSELQAARDRLREEFEAAQHENSELAGRLDSVFGQLRELCRPRGEELELADCEAAAAVLLRETIAELTDAWERDRRDSAVDATDAVDTAVPPVNSVNVPSDAAAFQIEPWSVEGPVRMGGVNGIEGHLAIDEAYVQWLPSSAFSDEPAQHHPLTDILFAEIDDADEVRHSADTS